MKKVVIIGAGPAGLTTAYKLLKDKEKYDVTVLELENQVGGICRTINYNGNRMDLGGHRFFTKSEEINKLWEEVMPKVDTPTSDKDKVFLTRNRLSRIYFNKKFFDYPVSLSLDTLKKMGFVNTMKVGFSYLASRFRKLDESNLENFYINRFGRKLYSMFFEGYTEKLWGRHPSIISADWGSQRVKGLSITKVLVSAMKKVLRIKDKNVETSLIDSFYYPKHGPGEYFEEMAKDIKSMGGKLLLNTRVESINVKNNKVVSVKANGNEYKCDYLVSTMPIKELCRMLPNNKKVLSISDNLPYRDFMTIGVILKKTNIKLEDTWIYVQEPNIKMGRIQVFNNWSPYLVKDKNTVSLGLEYFASEGDENRMMKDKDFKDLAMSELEDMGIASSKDLLDYHVERVKKAYPAYFDSYKDIDKVISYLDKFDNLYCVGRNGMHRYNNMDHSMLAGIECYKNIKGLSTKKNIWNINTEKEYHEETNKRD